MSGLLTNIPTLNIPSSPSHTQGILKLLDYVQDWEVHCSSILWVAGPTATLLPFTEPNLSTGFQKRRASKDVWRTWKKNPRLITKKSWGTCQEKNRPTPTPPVSSFPLVENSAILITEAPHSAPVLYVYLLSVWARFVKNLSQCMNWQSSADAISIHPYPSLSLLQCLPALLPWSVHTFLFLKPLFNPWSPLSSAKASKKCQGMNTPEEEPSNKEGWRWCGATPALPHHPQVRWQIRVLSGCKGPQWD